VKLFLDSSALVCLYIEQFQSSAVQAFVLKASSIVVSTLALPETARVIFRLAETQAISQQQASASYELLLSEWQYLSRTTLDDILAKEATVIARQHGLKGADAVQLATALYNQRHLSQLEFLSFDVQLNMVAAKVGLTLASL
jgi:uncharacterized protein